MTARGLSGYQEEWSAWLGKVFEGHPVELLTMTFAARSWERDAEGPTGPTISRVKRAARRYAQLLTTAMDGPSFFVCMERGSWNGRRHLHSLISSTEPVVIRAARAIHSWEGFTNVSSRSGSVYEYVTKYVSKSDGDFWLAGGPLFNVR